MPQCAVSVRSRRTGRGRSRWRGGPKPWGRKPKREEAAQRHPFDVLIALGLTPNIPTETVNGMHVMESECEKSSDLVVSQGVPESAEKLVSNGIVANKPKETQEPNPEEDIEEDVDEAVCELENCGAVPNVVVNGGNEDSGEREAKVKGGSLERIGESVERIEESGEVLSVANEVSLGDKEPTKVDTKHQKEEGVCSEEEDRNSISSSQGVENNRKRRAARGSADGSSSDTDSSPSANKRPRSSHRDSIDERERLVQDYVESCAGSVEEMSRVAEKLSREIGALAELARTKELEWNSILRLRKLKEEMLERLYRRKRQTMFLTDNGLHNEWSMSIEPKMMVGAKCSNGLGPNSGAGGQLVFVPVSPPPGYTSTSVTSSRDTRAPDSTNARLHRPILPKPSQSFLDQQNTVIGEGRQGPILDVKSIIADYRRSRHPESVPRRGRRLKQPLGTMAGGQGAVVSSTRITGSPALMSMANMALGSGGGAHVRIMPHDAAPFSLGGHDNSRPSSSDSSRSTELPSPNISFKDVLVQFAKMKQPPLPPPPPPYPEVTLHPVTGPPSPPPAPHTSLLHGILTKSHHHRPTTFSPTLARLLTAPERLIPPTSTTTSTAVTATTTSQFRPPAKRVSISDLLTSSKKSRNEITITPVSELSPIAKPKDEVVLLDDEDEVDSADRLVIDESRDTGTLPADEVPQCQGCHLQSAQFVCAGCGNQWYCSRDCQVLAWEEHSEVCSG